MATLTACFMRRSDEKRPAILASRGDLSRSPASAERWLFRGRGRFGGGTGARMIRIRAAEHFELTIGVVDAAGGAQLFDLTEPRIGIGVLALFHLHRGRSVRRRGTLDSSATHSARALRAARAGHGDDRVVTLLRFLAARGFVDGGPR